MRQMHRDALKVIREARAHATRTSDSRLHLACCRTVEALVAEGGVVPSDLRLYARQTREHYGLLDARTSSATRGIPLARA
jgi:hypothetical protein